MTIIFLEISISISGFIIHIQEIMEDAINRMPLTLRLVPILNKFTTLGMPNSKKVA